MDLDNVETCELVSALEKREGVKKTLAEPYQCVEISEEGPAIILTIID